jgi:glycosyltransferase involved in cell wall biosynthesis
MSNRILYVYTQMSTFVSKDIEILREGFEVELYHFKIANKLLLPIALIKQFVYLLFQNRIDAYVIQFAGYHSFLPALFSRIKKAKSIIILGGTDTVSLPSIRYGSFNKKILRFFTAKSLCMADLLLPVSESLVFTPYTYQKNDFNHQGYKYFIPKIKTPYQVIYNGYKKDKWYIAEKPCISFVTVGANLQSRFGVSLKGIDLICDIAERFPQSNFYIVGGKGLHIPKPENVIYCDKMSSAELAHFLAQQRYYLQLSMSEGFPNALCEAMMSGCVPIVSSVGAMPMIVDKVGYVLREKNLDLLEELINTAIKNYSEVSPSDARNKILTNYTFEKRQQQLNDAVLKEIQKK